MMTLRLFSDIKGLWQGEDKERAVGRDRSTVEISVRDGGCTALSGTVTVNGSPFPVKDGYAKLNTEKFSRHGASAVSFITESGAEFPCSEILSFDGAWYLPSPSEAVNDDEVLELLVRIRDLRSRVIALGKLCATPVSSVLGI